MRLTLFTKVYTCFRLTAVAVILLNHEFSLLNVFFQSNYGGIYGLAGIGNFQLHLFTGKQSNDVTLSNRLVSHISMKWSRVCLTFVDRLSKS